VIVVVKIGTSSITAESGELDDDAIVKLCAEVAGVRAAGHRVILVTSGAIAAGMPALGLTERPADVGVLQAIAAVGQPRLMERYGRCLGAHGLVPGQVLLTAQEFGQRTQYLHARETLEHLFGLGVVPVVNENDTIANDEIRYGDNDRLAALLAHNVGADVLVLLTDIDGLYTADPRTDPSARIIAHVASDDPLLAVNAGARGTTRGSGGMASKLAAARIASWSGVRTVIARAQRQGVLNDAVDGVEGVGTTFAPHDRSLSARKLWIAFAAQSAGVVVVDEGARRAMVERNTSLLPAGVLGVEGHFDEGDTVEVRDVDGAVFARGMVQVDAGTLQQMRGRRTTDLPEDAAREVIHRDDLVLLPG